MILLLFLEITEVMKIVAEIENLVKAHDILFLLVDTREGRWLPTLLATLHSKVKKLFFCYYENILAFLANIQRCFGF